MVPELAYDTELQQLSLLSLSSASSIPARQLYFAANVSHASNVK